MSGNDNNNLLGNNIRALREEFGETQTELAKFLNVSRTSISQYENGKNIPDLMVIKDIANHYMFTVQDLMCKDLSSFKINVDKSNIMEWLNSYSQRLNDILPIVKNQNAMINEQFKDVYTKHKTFYDFLQKIKFEDINDFENAKTILYIRKNFTNFLSCLDEYIKTFQIEDNDVKICSAINYVSIYHFMAILRLALSKPDKTAIISKIKEINDDTAFCDNIMQVNLNNPENVSFKLKQVMNDLFEMNSDSPEESIEKGSDDQIVDLINLKTFMDDLFEMNSDSPEESIELGVDDQIVDLIALKPIIDDLCEIDYNSPEEALIKADKNLSERINMCSDAYKDELKNIQQIIKLAIDKLNNPIDDNFDSIENIISQYKSDLIPNKSALIPNTINFEDGIKSIGQRILSILSPFEGEKYKQNLIYMMKTIKSNKKIIDIYEYYTALEFINNIVENKEDCEMNSKTGYMLMKNAAEHDNKYAKKFLKYCPDPIR